MGARSRPPDSGPVGCRPSRLWGGRGRESGAGASAGAGDSGGGFGALESSARVEEKAEAGENRLSKNLHSPGFALPPRSLDLLLQATAPIPDKKGCFLLPWDSFPSPSPILILHLLPCSFSLLHFPAFAHGACLQLPTFLVPASPRCPVSLLAWAHPGHACIAFLVHFDPQCSQSF